MRFFRRTIVYLFAFSLFCIGGMFASRPAYAGVNIDNYTRTPLGAQISGSVTIGFRMASSQYGPGELNNVSVIRMSIHGVDDSVTFADIPFSNENQYPTFAPLSWTGGFAQGFQLLRIDLQLIYADGQEGDESPIYEESGFTIIGQPTNDSPGKNEVAPQEVSVSVLPSQCSTDPNVYLVLHAREASQVRVSNVADFSDASWGSFDTGTDYTVLLNWRVTDGDGEKTIYTQFRSPIGKVESDVVKAHVRLDTVNRCRSDEDHAYISSQLTRSQRFDNPACVADYGHAKIGLYFATPGTTTPAAQTQATAISEVEQVVVFNDDEEILDAFVVRMTHAWDEATLTMKPTSSTFPFDLRARIDAAEMGQIDDVLLIPHGTPMPGEYELDLKGRKELCETYELPQLQSGSLIRSQSSDVYLYGKDGKRHAFPEGVFASWYPTSTSIRTIPRFRLEKIPLGANVAFRPGTLVRLGWTSARYVVDARQMLRPLLKESLIATVFGSAWMQVMRTLDVAYVAGYAFGNPVVSSADVANIQTPNDSPDRWEA